MTAIGQAQPNMLWNTNVALLAGGVITSGPLGLQEYLNGELVGNVFTDVPGGVLVVTLESFRGSGGLSFTVPVDAAQPPFNYPFFIALALPYATVTYTNGGAPAAFARAFLTVRVLGGP